MKVPLEPDPGRAYLHPRRVLLRFASEDSHPGDLNRLFWELSLFGSLGPRTRRPPG